MNVRSLRRRVFFGSVELCSAGSHVFVSQVNKMENKQEISEPRVQKVTCGIFVLLLKSFCPLVSDTKPALNSGRTDR